MTPDQLLPTTLAKDAPRRLFCFPHAGGGTALFYRWQRYLPDDVALAPLRLPGREDRLAEAPYTQLTRLADAAAGAIAGLDAKPFTLCGHSLGAYVALEVARRLIASGGPTPARLVVAACGSPQPGKARQPIGKLPDEEFLDEVSRRYDGIPQAVRDDATLLAMVLPALRADIQMIESYDYQPQEPLPIDILALGGADDPGVAVHRLQGWRQATSAEFTMRLFPGGHFFLHPPPRRRSAIDDAAIPAPLAAILSFLPPGSVPE